QDAEHVARGGAVAHAHADEGLLLQLRRPAADGARRDHPLVGVLRARITHHGRAVGTGVGVVADPNPEGLVPGPLALAAGAADLLEGVDVVLALERVVRDRDRRSLGDGARSECGADDEQGCELRAHAGVNVAVRRTETARTPLTPGRSGRCTT